MVKKNRHSQAGFTLLELVTAAMIGSIVILGAGSVFFSQKNFHKSQTNIVTANQSMRRAMAYMRDKVAMMGYGMPRTLVTSSCSTAKYLGSTACGTTTDSNNDYVGDRLHVMYRNPLGEWRGSSYDGGASVTLSGPTANDLDANFPVGQTLLLYAGSSAYAIANASVAKTKSGTIKINIKNDTRYRHGMQASELNAVNSNWTVGLVHNYMFRVWPHQNSKGEFVNTLIVEPGRDVNNDGVVNSNDYLPLAENVYSMEVEYFYDSDCDGRLSNNNTNKANETVGYPASTFRTDANSNRQNNPLVALRCDGVSVNGTLGQANDTSANLSNNLAAMGQLAAVKITLTVYRTDTPKVRPNSLDFANGAGNSRYSISEYIQLRNTEPQNGVVTAYSDSNAYVWLGSDILRVSAQ